MLTSLREKEQLFQTWPSIASSLPSTSFPPAIGCRTSLPSPGCSTSLTRPARTSETNPTPRQGQGATLEGFRWPLAMACRGWGMWPGIPAGSRETGDVCHFRILQLQPSSFTCIFSLSGILSYSRLHRVYPEVHVPLAHVHDRNKSLNQSANIGAFQKMLETPQISSHRASISRHVKWTHFLGFFVFVGSLKIPKSYPCKNPKLDRVFCR